MQPLKHDMDDLFRKAAADYPLKTGEDDWGKIASKLAVAAAVPEVVERKKPKYLGLLLLLISFLILGGVVYHYLPGSKSDFKTVGLNKTVIDRDEVIRKQKHSVSAEQFFPSKVNSERVGHKGTKAQRNTKFFSGGQSDVGARSRVRNSKIVDVVSVEDGEASNHKLSEHELSYAQVKTVPLSMPFSISAKGLHFTPIKIADNQLQRNKGFYLGLNGGPEFSKVGSQTITRIGYHGGLLIGYRVNKIFSLESGILFGKNKYYSSGKYFSMSKLAALMPAGMEIVNLQGESKQLEIPVSFKYDFVLRRLSNLFFTAGILSNIYLQEKNHYQTILNGVVANEMGLYNQDHYFIASQVTISGGYEHIVGKSFRLRIEPYKKIPLRKVGMGSMPVFSSGINVGLVRVLGR